VRHDPNEIISPLQGDESFLEHSTVGDAHGYYISRLQRDENRLDEYEFRDDVHGYSISSCSVKAANDLLNLFRVRCPRLLHLTPAA